MVHTHNKHYIGNVSASKFYYKNDIFAYYQMSLLTYIFPKEITDIILNYICSSLVVFGTNKTLHYINPNDNTVIKSIRLNKIRSLNSHNNRFAISEDGLTFYRIYRRHIELEYLCNEVPDINKPRYKKTFDTNRYYYSYNITKKCKLSTLVYPYGPIYGKYGDNICLSSDGKYIVTCASKENVMNKSGAYIAIYEAKTKTFVKEIKFNAEDILALSLSPDNNIVMAITSKVENKQTIWLWNIKNGANILQKQCDNNMYLESLDNKIAWNNDSTKFAITFTLNNNVNEENIGSCIFFGNLTNLSNTYITNILDKFVNHITWINNDKFAFKQENEIVFGIWNKQTEEIPSVILQNMLVYDLTSSIDGHLIIKYDKINLQTQLTELSFNMLPYYIENINMNNFEDNDIEEQQSVDEPILEANDWGQPSNNEEQHFEECNCILQLNKDDDYEKWLKEQEDKENIDDYDNVYNADYIDIISLVI
jgi:hypothetical protein